MKCEMNRRESQDQILNPTSESLDYIKKSIHTNNDNGFLRLLLLQKFRSSDSRDLLYSPGTRMHSWSLLILVKGPRSTVLFYYTSRPVRMLCDTAEFRRSETTTKPGRSINHVDFFIVLHLQEQLLH